jgi:hypothetical protein
MQVERHVFGSYRGYATLARSAGVSPDDCRAIEGAAFGFGQSYDGRYYKSLARAPAYFTRVLSGGRRALTKVMEGSPDDNQRSTLLLVSAIISQRDWDMHVRGNVEWLLQQVPLWQWNGSAQLAPMDISASAPVRGISRSSIPSVLALLSEIENNWATRRPVVVSANHYSLDDISAVEMLMPGAARNMFTSAYRSLSPQLPTTVNCLATEAGAQDKVTFRYHPSAPLSPYAMSLIEMDLTSAIPWEFVMTYNRFAARSSPVETAVASDPVLILPKSSRKQSLMPIAAVAVLAVILAAGAFVGAMALNKEQIGQVNDKIQALTKMQIDFQNTAKETEDDLSKKLDASNKNITKLQTSIGIGTSPQPTKGPANSPVSPVNSSGSVSGDITRLQNQLNSKAEQTAINELQRKLTAAETGVSQLKDAMKALTKADYEKQLGEITKVLNWTRMPSRYDSDVDNKLYAEMKEAKSGLDELGDGAFLGDSQASFKTSQDALTKACDAASTIREIKRDLDNCETTMRYYNDNFGDPKWKKKKKEMGEALPNVLQMIDRLRTRVKQSVDKDKKVHIKVGNIELGVEETPDEFQARYKTLNKWYIDNLEKR